MFVLSHDAAPDTQAVHAFVVTLFAVVGLLKNPKVKHPVAHNFVVLAHASQTPLFTT